MHTSIFKLQKKSIDNNKKNLLFIYENFFNHATYNYYNISTAWAYPYIEQIKDKYNIFILSLNGSMKNFNLALKLNKIYKFNIINYFIKEVNNIPYKRYNEINDSKILNLKITDTLISDIFNECPIFDEVHIIDDYHLLLPLTKTISVPTKYKNIINEDNSFFDYIGNDENILNFINDNINDIINKINTGKIFSPLAFSLRQKYFCFRILYLLCNKFNAKKIIGYIYDPNVFYPYLYSLHNDVVLRYFENDNRGIRRFVKFPIQEYQYLIYGKKYLEYNKINLTHNKLFVFEGTIFTNRCNNSRLYLWHKYLKNLNLDDSDFYFKLDETDILSDEIKKHKSYKGSYHFNDKFKILPQYKYSLIIKPTNQNDSLNYRITQSILLNQLPLIAEEYDPENLLNLDLKIKDKLIVKNSIDITNKIKYFENHKKEKDDIILSLYNFMIKNVKNIEYNSTYKNNKLNLF